MSTGRKLFTFFHNFVLRSTTAKRFAFVYIPLGSVVQSAIETSVTEASRGPLVPDAVVVVQTVGKVSPTAEAESLAEVLNLTLERTRGSVPLLTARLNLRNGKLVVRMLSGSHEPVRTELISLVRDGVSEWLTSGLAAIFIEDRVSIRAPSGYAFQKPSGKSAPYFLKPDLAFDSSAQVAFVALTIFWKVYARRFTRLRDLNTIFVDTMAIAPVAYALIDLVRLLLENASIEIESFHSYPGLESVPRPLGGTSLCLISSSTSMAMQRDWITQKGVGADEVVTLLTVSTVGALGEGALYVMSAPVWSGAVGRPLFYIKMSGETFFPQEEPAKRLLLNHADHRCDGEILRFRELAGRDLFDMYRPALSGQSEKRSLFVDGFMLVKQVEFDRWLRKELCERAKVSTATIVFQEDGPSRAFASLVSCCLKEEGVKSDLALLSASDLRPELLGRAGALIVCAAVVGKGSKLLDISRRLRDLHDGPRLYLIGFQIADVRAELKSLDSNLSFTRSSLFEVRKFGSVAIGPQLGDSFTVETETYYPASRRLVGLPRNIIRRANRLRGEAPLGNMALMPGGVRLSDELSLRPGFAFWDGDYPLYVGQAEVLGSVGVILQRAREDNMLREEMRLSSRSYRQVVLDPENFTRFNDGLLQAALLRNANVSELDYRVDPASSAFMRALVLRIISRAAEDAGEAALEFLLALALGRLQLADFDLNAIKMAIAYRSKLSKRFQQMIDFIFQTTWSVASQELPF